MFPAFSLVQCLWWSLAALFVVGAIGVGGWALFGDGRPFVSRAAIGGRRRCPRCWYDMSRAHPVGVEATTFGDHTTLTPRYTCSECGKSVRGVAGLQKTRRRWKRVPLAVVLLCVAWQTALVNTPGRVGWQGLVPTAWYLLVVEDFRSVEAQPLVARLRRHGIATPWDRWWATYKELAILNIDWNELIATRSKWPIDRPLHISFGRPWSAQSVFDYRTVYIRCLESPEQVAENYVWADDGVYHMVGGPPSAPYWIDLPPPKLGAHEYTFDLSIHSDSGVRLSRRVSIKVEGVRTLGESITLIDDPTLRQSIAGALSIGMADRSSRISISPTYDFWSGQEPTMAIPCKAELLRDGEVVARSGDSSGERDDPGIGIEHLVEYDEDSNEWWLAIDGLVARITPDYRTALHSFHRTACWSGVIEMPLREIPFSIGDGEYIKLADHVDRIPMSKGMLEKILLQDADSTQ